MRLAFWLPRSVHLKIVCPIAAAARRRGHECVMLSPIGALCGPKDDIGQMLGYDPALKPFDLGIGIASEVDAEIHLRDVDWAITVGLRTAPAIRAYTRASGVKWAALDNVGDNLLYVLEASLDGQAALKDWDLATTLSNDARLYAAGLAHVAGARRAEFSEIVAVGYPELDQLGFRTMTREACRAKWNLPAGRIVLLAPAARPANLPRLRRWAWGRWTYASIVRQIRRFCDRHGAILVTKTRAKHGDPPWLADLSDRYIGQTSFYPFDTLELVVAADLVVGFASTLAVEASAVGRPQVWLHAWPPEESEWPVNLPLRQRFFLERGGLWNNAGARPLYGFGPRWRRHLGFWAECAAWPRPTEAGQQEMRAAVERWAGPLDGKAAERFLDLLERQHGRR